MSKEDEAPALLEVPTADGTVEVRVTHPSKVYFPSVNVTKLEIVRYFVAVADGALRGIRDRPIVLKRFVDGAAGEPFYQKRAPSGRPAWLRTTVLSFPSGRTAEEVVVDDVRGLGFVANLGCMELHPHAVRSGDLSHPDELRIDLDPGPGVAWDDVRRVALEVRALLAELGMEGFPKTSGSRGIHVNVRIEPRWDFDSVRRCALAFAREIERRAPTLATSKWWKEERHGVFLDYNQNAKDRTTCSAYSIRPLPDARVSAPLSWDELPACEPGDFTIFTMPRRHAALGDLHAAMDARAFSLEPLLDLSASDDARGLPDAPWPPHHGKRAGEAPRVSPSRRKKAPADPTQAKAKGRRTSTMPLLVIAQARKKDDALAGLERWKARHAEASAYVAIEDVLVDSLRGRSSPWTRVRVNLRNVPEALRPEQGTPDPNEDLAQEWRGASKPQG